ncbi:MAG: hypothetical protein M3P27_06835 [Acidobacteriota bacterium]|nr:hypothetical protein [Acidobacteriota bacterium]
MPKKVRGNQLEFLASVHELASSYVRRRFSQLPPTEQIAVRRMALRVLQDRKMKRDEKLRDGAVRFIVALLPKTLPLVRRLLADRSSPLWYEVHFMIFASLDKGDFDRSGQASVLRLVHDYLSAINSDAGSAAWKAGDLLGDEWFSHETEKLLQSLLLNANHPAGRRAALHGIEHALNHKPRASRDRLFALVRQAASHDRSAVVRRDAALALRGVGCGPSM